jgi:hypothetical protein
MSNTRNPSGSQTPNSDGRPGQSQQDSGRQWQGNQKEGPEENSIDDHDGNVEVGDPVPENERTIRAVQVGEGLSNGQGETGEDEGLSGDAGDNKRH